MRERIRINDSNGTKCASFIVDQRWLELESLQSGDIANINYDSVKLL